MPIAARTLLRCGRFLPALFALHAVGCLPDNAIREVFAENIVRTSAIVIQSVVALIFGAVFPF